MFISTNFVERIQPLKTSYGFYRRAGHPACKLIQDDDLPTRLKRTGNLLKEQDVLLRRETVDNIEN